MQRPWILFVALGVALIAPNPLAFVQAATPTSLGAHKLTNSDTGHSASARILLVQAGTGHAGGGSGGRAVGGGGGMGPRGGGGPGPGGGGFGHGGGGLPGGIAPHVVAPGAGLSGPRFAPPQGRIVAPGSGPRIVAPYGRRAFVPGGVQRAPQFTPRPGVGARFGAHYPRYRHRRRGFGYYYGGWWYAAPWWTYGGYCDDIASECAYQWGWYSPGYYACMSYSGC
jgi:hypothetical protein